MQIRAVAELLYCDAGKKITIMMRHGPLKPNVESVEVQDFLSPLHLWLERSTRDHVSSQGCFAGKTTFIRMLHGSLKADDEDIEIPEFRVSYKPQKISPKFPGSVRLAMSHSCVLPQSVHSTCNAVMPG